MIQKDYVISILIITHRFVFPKQGAARTLIIVSARLQQAELPITVTAREGASGATCAGSQCLVYSERQRKYSK